MCLFSLQYNKHISDKCIPSYSQAHPVDFLIAIASFILPWVETWVLDFQVIPREKAILEGTLSISFQEMGKEVMKNVLNFKQK